MLMYFHHTTTHWPKIIVRSQQPLGFMSHSVSSSEVERISFFKFPLKLKLFSCYILFFCGVAIKLV